MNANTNKISNKKLLNDYFKSLPDNEVDKGKKVKLINAFLVNNLYDHEWFRQIVKNGSTLIQVSQYYNINIQIINNLFAIDIRYQNDLFCEYLYEVITYHDYNYNNNGIGAKKVIKGKNIPIIARLTKISKDIDSLLRASEFNFEEMYECLENNSDILYDPDIVNIILDSKIEFTDYLNFIYFKKKNKKYGLNINYLNIYNSSDNKKIKYIYVFDYINDLYFGSIKRSNYELVSVKYDYYFLLDKMVINESFKYIKKYKDNDVKFIIPISNKEITNESFINYLITINNKYKLKNEILFGIKDDDLNIINLNLFLKNIKQVNNLFGIGITNFIGKLILKIDNLKINFIELDKSIIDSLYNQNVKNNNVILNLKYFNKKGIDLLSLENERFNYKDININTTYLVSAD